jgi:pyridoxal phosphate enzyme (YggS family)
MDSLASRYQEIQERIIQASMSSPRNPEEITLVTVTKNHPAELVLDLLQLGARDFGENRDQEAAPKAEAVSRVSTPDFNWHFIGQLQTNKVKSVLGYAQFLHSLDRESLLSELVKRMPDYSSELGVFIQVNLTSDIGRGGIEIPAIEEFATKVLATPKLNLMGLMGVAGLGIEPERDFERLVRASQALQKISAEAKYLSMGMSNDFEVAIAMGATHLRIGSAITGNRPG